MDTENTRLKGLIGSNKSDEGEISRLNGLIGTYKNDNEVQGAKVASLEAEIVKLNNRPAPAAAVRCFSAKRQTPRYTPHPDPQI